MLLTAQSIQDGFKTVCILFYWTLISRVIVVTLMTHPGVQTKIPASY